MKDDYKVKIIDECLSGMEKDEYYIVRLKGDSSFAINLDKDALLLLRDYYSGKEEKKDLETLREAYSGIPDAEMKETSARAYEIFTGANGTITMYDALERAIKEKGA